MVQKKDQQVSAQVEKALLLPWAEWMLRMAVIMNP